MSLREQPKAVAGNHSPDQSATNHDVLAASLLDDLRNEASDFIESRRRLMPSYLAMDELKIGKLESGRKILDLDADGQIAVVRAAVDASFPARAGHFTWTYMLRDRVSGLVANQILRRKLPYSRQDVEWLLTRIAVSQSDWNSLEMSAVSARSLLRSIERWTQGDGEISESARASLRRLREGITRSYFSASGRKFLDLIDELIGVEEARGVDASDDWGHYALAAVDGLSEDVGDSWIALLDHGLSITGTKPSKRWLSETATLADDVGHSRFEALALEFLGLLDRPTRDIYYEAADGYDYPSAWIADRNADILKGILWSTTCLPSAGLIRAAGDAALACYTKIPNYGARSTKAGNAAVLALAAIPGAEAIAQLQRILQRVKLPSQRAQVEKALDAAATAQGLSRDDLDELLVPGFGLQDGVVRRDFGEYIAEIAILGADRVDLCWLRPDGKRQKSVPAPIKRDDPDQIKDLKRIQKEIREELATQHRRIERLMIRECDWEYSIWRERYLDHPLVSHIARRLIWTVEQSNRAVEVAWLDGRLVDVVDHSLDLKVDNPRVRLWHPIGSDAGTVLAWREWLDRHGVTQPFKQAHREIYLLTDAERVTGTYSNRFAAHILRQHQLNALCQERGWHYRLQGEWDGFNVPTVEVPGAGLRAEFWVEGIDQDDAVSHSFVYLYVATDQVRFVDIDSGLPVSLDDVAPRIFSEIMRDVDLFVAVSSIGADPNWLDGGSGRIDGYQDYWWDASFGDLSASAETRGEVLAKVLPRLTKLAGRWELDGRFLNLRGELRSYRIHLGSGNILMEPNGQYLCIVPGPGAGGFRAGDGLFLPFEGDRMLSVIISKALMLADDANITDPTIARQISGEPLRLR